MRETPDTETRDRKQEMLEVPLDMDAETTALLLETTPMDFVRIALRCAAETLRKEDLQWELQQAEAELQQTKATLQEAQDTLLSEAARWEELRQKYEEQLREVAGKAGEAAKRLNALLLEKRGLVLENRELARQVEQLSGHLERTQGELQEECVSLEHAQARLAVLRGASDAKAALERRVNDLWLENSDLKLKLDQVTNRLRELQRTEAPTEAPTVEPQRRVFEIWSEGYLATGMEGVPQPAFFKGTGYGKDFLEACKLFHRGDSLYREDEGVPSYWGCRLFDNEADARKSFG